MQAPLLLNPSVCPPRLFPLGKGEERFENSYCLRDRASQGVFWDHSGVSPGGFPPRQPDRHASGRLCSERDQGLPLQGSGEGAAGGREIPAGRPLP